MHKNVEKKVDDERAFVLFLFFQPYLVSTLYKFYFCCFVFISGFSFVLVCFYSQTHAFVLDLS